MKCVFPLLLAALAFLVPASVLSQPAETEFPGVTAEVVELAQTGGVLRLAVRLENAGTEAVNPYSFTADRFVLVDVESMEKHLPIKDAEGRFVAGPLRIVESGTVEPQIPAGYTAVWWAYFEPVAPGTVVNVEVPYMFPFENVPVTEGAGEVFLADAASTTPLGGTATLVSAKRADQVLTVRLRLAAEAGREVDLTDSYFRFNDVYLLDTAGKRKYPLLRDSQGGFQAQPITTDVSGGSFIHHWDKTTLVSLSFPAPPGDAQSVDLFLPEFLPMASIPIEGSGGAGAGGGGIATAGQTLGIEGALKDLGAEVTETEIRIDLSADVLFDFDSADVKTTAEPSLRNVATVIRDHPTATVRIEGHTDGMGADAYNQTLSESRAVSVKQWLVSNAQIDGAHITTRGWGESKPIAQNSKPDGSDDPEGRAKNRRVEIVVQKGA